MDRKGISARVRALLATEDTADETELARRLNVSELSLRMTIDELSPHPTIEVLTAVVGHFGADPSWVLTGDYDAGHHRRALEGNPAVVEETVRELAHPLLGAPDLHPPTDTSAEAGRSRRPIESGQTRRE